MKNVRQQFNALIESILIKRCKHDLFYIPAVGLDMFEPYSMAGLGMLDSIIHVNKIKLDIGVYCEDLRYNYTIHTIDHYKRAL